ncbi:unnamed protein product [Pleuronectes platessa]|uniref:Uncharacterized protein n=1 Tax=Pleuronectes platessa TaxID=8262 RepID=A0A9N7UMN8_PLEPL|nr:unnamed protein product [Pleuronectes platessa]
MPWNPWFTEHEQQRFRERGPLQILKWRDNKANQGGRKYKKPQGTRQHRHKFFIATTPHIPKEPAHPEPGDTKLALNEHKDCNSLILLEHCHLSRDPKFQQTDPSDPQENTAPGTHVSRVAPHICKIHTNQKHEAQSSWTARTYPAATLAVWKLLGLHTALTQ